jgi:alpha-L-fucosidase
LAWWREARFGLFIHWGVYAVPAGRHEGTAIDASSEWLMQRARLPVAEYRKFGAQFNPLRYQPDEWAALAQTAGMKYLVITAKHHDGFALFPSQASDWNVADATPYGRDLLGPLAEACRRRGLRLGFYYSQAQDWVNGGTASGGPWDAAQQRPLDAYIDDLVLPQLEELLTRYGAGTPALLWWDTPHGITPAIARRVAETVRKHAPGVILNSRLGGGEEGDFDTPECFVPAAPPVGRAWESCITTNNSWGFCRDDTNWKSAGELLRLLCEAIAKGGNFLLNIGPQADGAFPPEAVALLREIGNWMRVNGTAIHGAQAGPFPYRLPWGYASRRDDTLYLFVLDWPEDGAIRVPLRNRLARAVLLAQPESPLPLEPGDGATVIRGPREAPDARVTVVAVTLEGAPELGNLPPAPRAPLIPQPVDGSLTLTAGDAELIGTQVGVVEGHLGFWSSTDSYPRWRVDVRQPGRYHVVLRHAVPAARSGSEVALTAGQEHLHFTLPATTGWNEYEDHPVGEIALTQSGETTLELRPLHIANEAVMNLKAVLLQPLGAA